MTARDRLARARAMLGAAMLGAALLWSICAGLVVYASLVGAALVGGRWVGAALAVGIATAASITVGAAIAWRGRHAWSRSHVALWIEERVPGLRYSLVTSLEPQPRGTAAALEQRIAGTRWDPVIRSAAVRATSVPLAAAVMALVLLVALPALRRPLAAAARAPAGRLTNEGAPVPPATRLSPLRVRVEPPGYSGLATQRLDDPAGIPALAGSRLVV
ncbi:MAG: hypothetical protein ACR2HZ_06075, partial [Gemmatimonadaceae bacterium]